MAKVLLVEDDNNLREIYQARLTAEGYDIVAAQDGEEALVVAKQEHPDLIISDVMMPRISGFEMLDILRNTDELKHTKIIMLTALGQAEDQSRADTLGADKYLVKSQVTLEDIINSAKELLGENEAAPADPAPATEPAVAVAPVATPAAPVSEPAPAVSAPVATAEVPVAAVPVEPVSPPPAAPQSSVAPPVSSPAPESTAAVSPVTNDTAVPASVAPEPGTTVVVPPAPANPTPPAVTTAPITDPVTVTPVDQATPTDTAAPIAADASAAPASDPVQTPPATPVPEPAAVQTPSVSAEPVTEPPVAPAASDQANTPESPLHTPGQTITPNVASSETAVSESTPQSIEAEEAALEAQIKQFTDAPAETPAPQAATASDLLPDGAVSAADQAEVNDAAVIANAVDQLNGPAPAETTEAPAVPAPATETPAISAAPAAITSAPAPSNDQVSVNGKKVIAPLGNPENKPSLEELLAREEAKETGAPAAPQEPTVNSQTGTTPPVQKPGDNFDPNSISL